MPDIDVSDVLGDPDVAGTLFTVIRRQETVNNFGRPVLTTSTYPDPAADPPLQQPFGAIYPTGDNSMVRADAYTTQSDTITVVTPFRLRGPSKSAGVTYQADIVLWEGTHYIVKTVNDYSKFGAGMIQAECTAYDYNVQAPT
jgi:hypothetical protein